MTKNKTFSAAALCIAVILFVSVLCFCANNVDNNSGMRDYYLNNTGKQRKIVASLFKFLDESENIDDRFSLVRELANQYTKLEDYPRLINFLSEWIRQNPNDPYSSYYLLRIADCYMRENSEPIAALYFDLIVRNHSDLIIHGESIHLICLKELINLVDNPEQKLWYYEQLILRFPDKTDLGAAYFMEGRMYEQLGRWKDAINAYRNFIPFYGTIIPGFPDAYAYAKQMVDFNTILKNYNNATKLDRTFESLGSLVGRVHRALDDGDTYRLWNYRTRVNFFARSWSQIGGDEDASDFNLSSLSASGKIQYADELSRGSGANDAYLKTWGWSKFTPIWYFYFRKIYFPMDPDINGRWEWAGVYYGERF